MNRKVWVFVDAILLLIAGFFMVHGVASNNYPKAIFWGLWFIWVGNELKEDLAIMRMADRYPEE